MEYCLVRKPEGSFLTLQPKIKRDKKCVNITFFFQVLTVIIFFSSAVSVLYYWGVMQFIIKYISRFLAWCLGTSPTESLNAAGNIFIGQVCVVCHFMMVHLM